MRPDLGEFLAKELVEHERNWPRGLPEGVIHADLFPDNVFFLGDTLSGLIDRVVLLPALSMLIAAA